MTGVDAVLLPSVVGACFGAVAGSFLNVVIHRIPRLIVAGDEHVPIGCYLSALAWPPSHCPGCAHRLKWRDNIPLLSYLMLRGRCRSCQASFGCRYFIVELLAAAAFAYCAAVFGLSAQGFLGATFIAGLVALSVIDIEEQLLPDAVLAPLFCLGLVFQMLYGRGIADAAVGAAAGFGMLWLIRESYMRYAGAEGMGFGDLKFAGMLGAWLGIGAIPALLFIAFASGVAVMLPVTLAGRIGQRAPIPFGPFLAFGGLCAFLVPNLLSLAAGVFRLA